MGIWLELRCDSGASRRCYSKANTGPMAMSRSNTYSLLQTLTSLYHEATQQGWKRRRNGDVYVWHCPDCDKETQ